MAIVVYAALAWLVLATSAYAGPLLGILPFISSIIPGITSFLTSLGLNSAIAGALAQAVVSVAVIGAAALIQSLFQPSAAASVFNVKVDEGPRRHAMGACKLGGQTIFASFGNDGTFWYIVVHCDEELVSLTQTLLDDIPVTIDSDHVVTDSTFGTVTGGFLGIGAGPQQFFHVWTQTYTTGNPVPPAVAAFQSTFPAWTDDYKLAGTTFSIVKIEATDSKSRPAIYKWQQGACHIGDPGVQIIGQFGRAYDPRDPSQNIDDHTTWQPTSNSALLWAWWRYFAYGFGDDIHSIAWDQVELEADVCDSMVLDKDGVSWARYACSAVWTETRDNTNSVIEQKILATCDGAVLTDPSGLTYCKVGRWEEPAITLTPDRDVLALASQAVNDGEAQLDGVVVTYTEAAYGSVLQPSAPWYNPTWYDPATDTRTPDILSVTVEFCPSHNQAVRLAKAIGAVSQAPYKLAPTLGVRSIVARQSRIVAFDYDDTFTGAHQLITPVEIDLDSMTGTVTLAPVNSNTWTLLPGEEGDRPLRDLSDFDASIPAATDVVLRSTPIAGGVRITATFDPPPSVIYSYEFYYSADGGTTWIPMEVQMTTLSANSDFLSAGGATYVVEWRTVTSGGNYGAFSSTTTIVAGSSTSLDFSRDVDSQYLPLF